MLEVELLSSTSVQEPGELPRKHLETADIGCLKQILETNGHLLVIRSTCKSKIIYFSNDLKRSINLLDYRLKPTVCKKHVRPTSSLTLRGKELQQNMSQNCCVCNRKRSAGSACGRSRRAGVRSYEQSKT